jgi:hypothetical protein
MSYKCDAEDFLQTRIGDGTLLVFFGNVVSLINLSTIFAPVAQLDRAIAF